MKRKNIAMEFYLLFFVLAAFSDKLQAGRMVFAWFLLGVILGTYYSDVLLSNLHAEIFIGVFGLILSLFIFHWIVGVKLFEDKAAVFSGDPSLPQFLFILWHPIFSGLMVALGSYISHGLTFEVEKYGSMIESN